jgi:hypothetical protein
MRVGHMTHWMCALGHRHHLNPPYVAQGGGGECPLAHTPDFVNGVVLCIVNCCDARRSRGAGRYHTVMSPKGAVIAKFSPLVESEGMPRVVATRVVVTTRRRRHRAIANGGVFAITIVCARAQRENRSKRHALEIIPNRFSHGRSSFEAGIATGAVLTNCLAAQPPTRTALTRYLRRWPRHWTRFSSVHGNR